MSVTDERVWTRLPPAAAVLTAWFGQRDTGVVEQLLEHRYGPVLAGARCTSLSNTSGGAAWISPRSVTASSAARTSAVCWGIPYTDAGDPSDEDLTRALRDPAGARLYGRYVLAGDVAGTWRVVTGPDVVHGLKQAHGPSGTALATRDLAVLDAAGVTPRPRLDVLPELIVFDYVLGDDELLHDVTLVEEATVTTEAGTTSWWPVHERMSPSMSAGPRDLRRVLAESLTGPGRLPGVMLALTAGRDSLLVASCLAEARLGLPTVTIGPPSSPDVIGAQAGAESLGWQHHRAYPAEQAPASDPGSKLLAMTAWTEGLDMGWNVVGPELIWPPIRGPLLSGSGGETGRAFYWPQGTDDPHSLLTAWVSQQMGPQAGGLLKERVDHTLQRLRPLAGDDAALLDLFYLRGRMRSWLERTRPTTSWTGSVPAFTDPRVIPVLLGLPQEDRRTGGAFEQALAADTTGVVAAARAAVVHPMPTGSRAGALAGRVRRRLGREPIEAGLALCLQTRAALPREARVTEEVMGPEWWRATVAAAQRSPMHRRWLWNAVSAEAAVAALGSTAADT